ncbi:MAG: ComEA family DNA-binding protein [Gammaproteobacteria bacterium]
MAWLLASPVWATVDINTAPQSELEAVPGIGPVKAQAIIDYRRIHGPFASLEDLDHVRGFGKTTIEKLRGHLRVRPVQAAPAVVKQEIRWSRPKTQEACPGCPLRK